jgi:hypothetical protein
MNKLRIINAKSPRFLTFSNAIIILYFLLLWIVYFAEADHVFIGVIVESLTLPFLVAQFVFLFLSIRFLLQKNIFEYKTLTGSLLLLLICVFLTIKSFFN